MSKTLKEIKRHNQAVGGHFFDRGNEKVLSKKGNYLITKGSSQGFVVFLYDEQTGRISHVDNPNGDYSWQPYENKRDAINYASRLAHSKQ